jgi:hypothetical protein
MPTNIFSNEARRDQEAAVAGAMAGLLIVNWSSTAKTIPPEVAAHCFGAACESLGYLPDEASAARILQGAVRELRERQRAVDRLNTIILQRTDDLARRRRI